MLQVRKSTLAIADWRQKDRGNSSWKFCMAWIKSDTLAANGERNEIKSLVFYGDLPPIWILQTT
jgi:hypothetical protein